MPPLNNARHEAFAQAVAKGTPKGQAALAAGFSERTAATQASQLLKKPQIRDRIAELKAPVQLAAARAVETRAARTESDVDRILGEIDTLALSDIRQLFHRAEDQLRFIPPDQWPDSIALAVSAIKIKEYPVKLPPIGSQTLAELQKLEDTLLSPESKRLLARVRGVLEEAEWSRYTVTEVKLWNKNDALAKAGQARGVFQDLSKLPPEERDRLEVEILNRAAERRRKLMQVQQGGAA